MNRIPVFSSRISSVGWENNTLEVQFKDGAIINIMVLLILNIELL